MVVVDGVDGFFSVCRELDGKGFAGLRVGFVERRTGAGNGDTDAVALVENLAQPADGPASIDPAFGNARTVCKTFSLSTFSASFWVLRRAWLCA